MRHFVKSSLVSIPILSSAFALALCPVATCASSWVFTPGVESSLILADNIALAVHGYEEAEQVLSIKPGFQISRDEGRTQVAAIYGLNNLFFANNPDKNASQHMLRGTAEAEVLRGLLFIGALATTTRQVVTPDAAVDLNPGSLAFSQDATQASTWALSPRLEQTFGGAAIVRTGINLIQVDYQGLLPDSFFREYFFDASNGPGAQDLNWSLDARHNETLYQGNISDNSRESAEMNVRYKVLPQWALTGRLGYTDFQNDNDPALSGELSGRTWRAGVAWLPSARTDFELGISENAFDRSSYAALNHGNRRLQLRAYYEESVTTRRQLQADYSRAQTTDPSVPVVNASQYLTISDDVFISKNARMTLGYKSEEFTATLSGYRDRREYQNTGERESVAGASLATGINLSRRATLDATLSQSSNETSVSQGTVTTTASVAVRRDFGTSLEGSINLNRTEQKAIDPLLIDYVAYFLTLSVRAAF